MKLVRNPKSKVQNPKLFVGALTLAWLMGAAAGPAQEPSGTARLTFTKTLQGSTPEFEEIVVDSDGSATYDGRKLSDSASPRQFKISAATTQRLFALAGA